MIIHPRAQRFISACNDRILNLNESFNGAFVFEEKQCGAGRAVVINRRAEILRSEVCLYCKSIYKLQWYMKMK